MTATTVIHECDNCDWEGPEDELACCMADMEGFYERISPGCPCPSGDCPECGACCYPRDENWRRLQSFDELLTALKVADAMLRPLVMKMSIRTHFHEHNQLENTIRKAIRKAEGGAP